MMFEPGVRCLLHLRCCLLAWLLCGGGRAGVWEELLSTGV